MHLLKLRIKIKKSVSVISSDSASNCKQLQIARFTSVPLKPYSDKKCVR